MTHPQSGRAIMPGMSLPLLTFLSFLLIIIPGCGRSNHSNPGATASNLKSTAKVTRTPVINVLENEALLRGSQADIGGIVQNITDQNLENLIVELELTARGDGQKTIRQVEVMPASITPGNEGTYNLTVSNHDWSGWRILRIRSGSRAEGLAFTSQPGAKRPPERTPGGKTIIIQRSKPKGEDFINTPDNPDPIR